VHHQIHTHQTQRNAPSLTLSLLLLQRIDQIDCRVEPHLFAVVRQPRDAQGRGQVGFARARPTNEHPVLLTFLPARCHVAEVWIEQVVAAHRIEAGIDDAARRA
jgi:hypothetical protein